MRIFLFPSLFFSPSRSYICVGTQLLLSEIHSVGDPFHTLPTTIENEKVGILTSPANKERVRNICLDLKKNKISIAS